MRRFRPEARAACDQGLPVTFPIAGGEAHARFDLTGAARVQRTHPGSSGKEGFPTAQPLRRGDQSQRTHAVVGEQLLRTDVRDLDTLNSQQLRQQLVQKIRRIRFNHPRLPFQRVRTPLTQPQGLGNPYLSFSRPSPDFRPRIAVAPAINRARRRTRPRASTQQSRHPAETGREPLHPNAGSIRAT